MKSARAIRRLVAEQVFEYWMEMEGSQTEAPFRYYHWMVKAEEATRGNKYTIRFEVWDRKANEKKPFVFYRRP